MPAASMEDVIDDALLPSADNLLEAAIDYSFVAEIGNLLEEVINDPLLPSVDNSLEAAISILFVLEFLLLTMSH
jgi:hypothetical protein